MVPSDHDEKEKNKEVHCTVISAAYPLATGTIAFWNANSLLSFQSQKALEPWLGLVAVARREGGQTKS